MTVLDLFTLSFFYYSDWVQSENRTFILPMQITFHFLISKPLNVFEIYYTELFYY